jgi:hypothetical protein
MSERRKAFYKQYARPDCQECDGDGWVTWTPTSDPTGGHDWEAACACTDEANYAENGPPDHDEDEDARGWGKDQWDL